MKKYFITISNGKRMILDIFPYAIVLFFTIIAISLSATVNGVVCLFVTVCFSALLIALLPTLIRMFYDCFYYDEQKNEIILKRFRVKDRRISLSDIDKLIPKRNEDPRMGATSARNETTHDLRG